MRRFEHDGNQKFLLILASTFVRARARLCACARAAECAMRNKMTRRSRSDDGGECERRARARS